MLCCENKLPHLSFVPVKRIKSPIIPIHKVCNSEDVQRTCFEDKAATLFREKKEVIVTMEPRKLINGRKKET